MTVETVKASDLRKAMDMRTRCEAALNHPISGGKISFVVPGAWANKKRLAGAGSPMGEAVAEYEDGILCAFNAQEVIDWIDKGFEALGLTRKSVASSER